jgi:cysteine desulfurase
MRERLTLLVPGVSFNNPSNSLYTILSVCFPGKLNADFILFNLDSAGICASGGSACSSGEDAGSHVIQALNRSKNGATIRFSFSKHNTTEDIDRAIEVIASLFPKEELTIA